MTTPLGNGAIDVTMVIAYLSLGLAGYLVYRLGSLWFDRPIGTIAALIVLTRAPYLSNGLRAYVDLPYIALCLGALVIESKRPRAGWPVLALLALAGLLRPEAWLFSVAYLAYMLLAPAEASAARAAASPANTSHQRSPEEETRAPLDRADTQRAGLIRPALGRARGALVSPSGAVLMVLALSAPLIWALFDWITTGSPTYSFTGTRETVDTLSRHTGPVDLVLWGPRALGEVMQWPGMVGAAGGVVLAFAFLRRRAVLGLVAAALALGAFALLAGAGLAIIARYTMLGGALLAIFVAVALLGWRLLEPGHPWRRRWQVFAGIVLLMFVLWLPNQWDLDSTVKRTSQIRARSSATSAASSIGRLRQTPLRSGRGAEPPRCPPPRLRPRSEADANRQRQRGRHPPPRLLPRPGQPLRHPQLHPRPQRPDPHLPRCAPRIPPGRPQRLLGPLPALLSDRSATALDQLDRGVGLGGDFGTGQLDPRRQLDVQVTGGVEEGPQRSIEV